MEKRKLGPSGLELSLVGLGCNNFGGRIDFEATKTVVAKALDLGITHFDTADIYGGGGKSEEFLGRLMGPDRKTIVLATKIGKPMPGVEAARRGARSYVRSAVDASLKRLKTDWIDLLWMHEPDPGTPIEETLRALDELVKAGKIRHVAASNYSAAEIDEAVKTARRIGVEGFVGCQDELSLTNRRMEKALLPKMKELGLGLVPYFPLGGGALTGKYRKGAAMPEGARHTKSKSGAEQFLDPHWDLVETLRAFADQRGHTLLELAMSWLARRPLVVSIIAGATKPEQLEMNVKSTGWALTPADMAEIEKITS